MNARALARHDHRKEKAWIQLKKAGGDLPVTCHPLNVPRLRFDTPVPNSTMQDEKLSGVGNPRKKSGLNF